MSDEPMAKCSNCGTLIAESKLMLHELYCARNCMKCERCKRFYDVNDPEAHEEEFHKKFKCEHCAKEVDCIDFSLEQHSKVCTKKPKACKFCKVEQQARTLIEHESQCGSRTKVCETCNKNILVRDLERHEATCLQELMKKERDEKEKERQRKEQERQRKEQERLESEQRIRQAQAQAQAQRQQQRQQVQPQPQPQQEIKQKQSFDRRPSSREQANQRPSQQGLRQVPNKPSTMVNKPVQAQERKPSYLQDKKPSYLQEKKPTQAPAPISKPKPSQGQGPSQQRMPRPDTAIAREIQAQLNNEIDYEQLGVGPEQFHDGLEGIDLEEQRQLEEVLK